jgi:hypothetical protein
LDEKLELEKHKEALSVLIGGMIGIRMAIEDENLQRTIDSLLKEMDNILQKKV